MALAAEPRLDPEVRPWLAFADEKLHELRALATARTPSDWLGDLVRHASE